MSTQSQIDPRRKYRDFDRRAFRVSGMDPNDDDSMANDPEPEGSAGHDQKGEAS